MREAGVFLEHGKDYHRELFDCRGAVEHLKWDDFRRLRFGNLYTLASWHYARREA